MTEDYAPVPNILSRWGRRQRAILHIGVVYDGGFGIPMFFFPVWSTGLLGLPQPGVPMWLRLDGIFLIIMALIYIVTARDPERYLGNVLVAIFGKVVSVLFYMTYVLFFEGAIFLAVLSFLDAVMCALHIWAIGPDKGAKIRAALEPARAVD